jgi:hypothetical protein
LTCGSEDGQQQFEFHLALALSPPVIWRVTYYFRAATNNNLISYISSTYKTERITNFSGLDSEMEVVRNDRWFSNGAVVWRLTDRILLALTRRESVPGGLTSYLLTAWDSEIDKQDRAAFEQIKNNSVPVPKF